MDKQSYYEIGLDLHKSYSQVAVVNPKGTTCKQVKIANNPQMWKCPYRNTGKSP